VDPHLVATVQTAARTFGPATVDRTAVTKVDVDVDGDGVNDGYVLVAHRDPATSGEPGHDAPPPADPPPAAHLPDDPAIGLVGHSFHYDPIG
jgi:hypothetical protein